METSTMESSGTNSTFPDIGDISPIKSSSYDFGDHLGAIRRQLRDELRVRNQMSDEIREVLRDLSVDERQVVVDRNCFALKECQRTRDMEFLIEKCAATILKGGAHCPLCIAIRYGDVDRVSIYVEYLLGKRPLKYRPDQRQSGAQFLTQLLVGNLLPQPLTPEAENTADLLIFHGASLKKEVHGGTLVEWAVRHGRRDWVRYLLDKEALPWQTPGGGRNALRLAAILRATAIFEEILLRPNVSASAQQEAEKLWDCANVIASNGCHGSAVPAWLTIDSGDHFLGGNSKNLPYRPDTNDKVKSVINAVGFVEKTFGQIPPTFAHDVLQHSSMYLPRVGSTTSDIVDLVIAVIDAVDEYTFSSRYLSQEDLIRVIRASRNDLRIPYLSRLLVRYCQRQLIRFDAQDRLQDWPSLASTLLELALANTACTRQLEELVRSLIDYGTYVGLSGMLVYDDTPLSATRLRRADAVGKLVHEAACCQLNYPDQCLANPPPHWRLRTLKCSAAHRLNRCLTIDQFSKLPNVIIHVHGMLIPLPYLVDSHNAGLLRSQRLQRPVEPACSCFGLTSKHIYSTY
ncbi:hypothetical protein BIW11_08595 [Tropilaelaps mercedesae]|uniref:Uncharacterized protein n=1 Tax=Tropilaelaps mercedesae TaxID=418985 RepID=A0A1V9XPB0_9ACAR|nr:hypothetical protein BIW11_08595 [Tropilaelaps mercedesae]